MFLRNTTLVCVVIALVSAFAIPSSVLAQQGSAVNGRATDVGVVAQVDGQDAGACWLRLLPVGVGLASVDAETPQLGIALDQAFQRQGHGRLLMREALRAAWLAGYRQVSLTVHPENPARFMYERCGFRRVGVRSSFHLMLASAG